ncbi:septum formation initiator family protein [Hahella sp. SMD15-11]|uniref:Cell division protein FtsB n=1 Tax=Thermohahella caldifontis TaxID=3142973 RepID=A0AB39UY29_9GAMM
MVESHTKWLWAGMGLVLFGLQLRLWTGEGSLVHAWSLQSQIQAQAQENSVLAARNHRLEAEIRQLRGGLSAVDEKARAQLGYIARGETFYLLVDPE